MVGAIRCAVPVEALNDEGYEAEGCDDTARVNRGMVWNVVEDAPEDVIVGELEEWPGCMLVAPRGRRSVNTHGAA